MFSLTTQPGGEPPAKRRKSPFDQTCLKILWSQIWKTDKERQKSEKIWKEHDELSKIKEFVQGHMTKAVVGECYVFKDDRGSELRLGHYVLNRLCPAKAQDGDLFDYARYAYTYGEQHYLEQVADTIRRNGFIAIPALHVIPVFAADSDAVKKYQRTLRVVCHGGQHVIAGRNESNLMMVHPFSRDGFMNGTAYNKVYVLKLDDSLVLEQLVVSLGNYLPIPIILMINQLLCSVTFCSDDACRRKSEN
jgi:hypothetical protein